MSASDQAVDRQRRLVVIVSSLLAPLTSTAALAEPVHGAAQSTDQLARSLLKDPQVQELALSIADGLPVTTLQQFEQLARLIASGATIEEIQAFAHSIVVPPEVLQLVKQLLFAAFYVSGLGFAAAAITKFKAHKSNPTQGSISEGVALTSIAAALVLLPALMDSSGATLFAS